MLRILISGAMWLTLGFSHLSAEDRSDVREKFRSHAQSLVIPEDPNGNTSVISDLEFSSDSKMLAVTNPARS